MIHDFDGVSRIFGKTPECSFAGVEPTNLPMTSSDAQSLSYRRLVGARP